MKKAGKIALALVTALTLVNCGTDVARDTSSPLSGRMQYAPTGLRDTSSHSSLNFADLEKEYKSFSTKALADTYVKKMFNKFLVVTPNSVQVIRQVEFSRYLKNNGDTSYETSLKNIFTDTPVLYSSLTGMPAVQSKMTSESGTFGFYILGVSPNQTVPTALPATNITETSFTANWSAVTGATSYTLILDGVEITGITGTNHTLNTLTAGSNHKYRVKAITSGVAGAVSNEINVNTVLTAPVASSATGITQTSLTANWSTVTGATSYTLVFNGTEITGITDTFYTKNGLTAGTTYPYYVKAVNTNTESVNSSTINTATVPSAPNATSATNLAPTSFTANWTAVTGSTGYKLTVDGNETDVGLVTSKNITGLVAGSGHTYSIKAYNTSGTTSPSNTVSVTLLPPIISTGLVVNLDAGNVASYSGTGTTWTDLSGNGNNGTLINGVGYDSSNGGSLVFDGINDYVNCGNNSVLNTTDITASAWVYQPLPNSINNIILARYGGGSNGWLLNYTSENQKFAFDGRESGVEYLSSPTTNTFTNLNKWFNVTGTKSGNVWKIYVDGVLENTVTVGLGNVAFLGKDLLIGSIPGFNLYGKANIGSVLIYSRALSQSEITQNFNADKSRFGL